MKYEVASFLAVILLLSAKQLTAEAVIEEHEDRVVVQIIGVPDITPKSGQPEPAVEAGDKVMSEKKQSALHEKVRKLQNDIMRLRIPVANDTSEMKLERKAQIKELQAELKQILQQQESATKH